MKLQEKTDRRATQVFVEATKQKTRNGPTKENRIKNNTYVG